MALVSLQETIDTSTPAGRLIFHLFGALAEFERNLIRERTQAGLTAARARGRAGGRPAALDPAKRALAVQLYEARTLSVAQICATLGISKPTLYAYVRAHQAASQSQQNPTKSRQRLHADPFGSSRPCVNQSLCTVGERLVLTDE